MPDTSRQSIEQNAVSLGAVRALQGLRTVFDETVHGELPYHFDATYNILVEAGWIGQRSFSPIRLARRLAAADAGRGLAILTRSGYKLAYAFSQKSREFRRVYLWNKCHRDAHKCIVMKHPDAPDTLAIVTGNTSSNPELYNMQGIAVFAPQQGEANAKPLVDLRQYSDEFNGTGPRFFTPAGKDRGLSCHWQRSGGSQTSPAIMGHLSTGGRDVHEKVVFSHRFPRELLPSLTLPKHCAVFATARYQIHA